MTNFDYKKFLTDKHSKYSTPCEVIETLIEKCTHQKLLKIKRLVKGEANEVYDITLDTKEELILRISRDSTNPFIAECWAMKKCADLGVPVAKILFTDEAQSDTETIFFSLLTKIEGMPLNETDTTNDEKFMHKILHQTGRYMSLIHKIKTDGFGEISGNGKGQQESYIDYLENKFGNPDGYIEAALKNELDKEQIVKAVDILFTKEHIFELESPVLAHGDLGTKHIMVKNDKITGILDFGNMRGSFPMHDFAWWEIWTSDTQQIEWLKGGYATKQVFEEEFQQKYRLIKLMLGLELLWWNNLEGHMSGINHAVLSIKEDLSYFK